MSQNYIPTEWIDNRTVGTASVMNNMEKGIENAHDRIDEVDSQINEKANKNDTIKTPEFFGAKGDGRTDDSSAFLNAMVTCSNNGWVLMLKGKYKIAKSIVYTPWRPLKIIGSHGNYPSLISEENPIGSESCDIFFSDGATLEINKFGSVTFDCVGFSSTGKRNGTGIILKSFHNKFINCTFSQMYKAITVSEGATNWNGENQVLYSSFYKCEYCYHSTAGSDSEFIGNLIHGSCGVGFYGSCAGYTISHNHFYGTRPNEFKFFNTNIVNNYFQELSDLINPTVVLNGSFGCQLNNNKFELVNDVDRPNPKSLVEIKTWSGGGNIQIDSNAVHGKTLKAIGNLAFIVFTSRDNNGIKDMPITMGTNNLRNCNSIFQNSYPTYNFKGTLSYKDMKVTVLGGVVAEQKLDVVNGVCHYWVSFSSVPTYSDLLKLPNYGGIPSLATIEYVTNSGSKVIKDFKIGTDGKIQLTNYGEVSTCEVFGSYVLAHATEPKYFL